MARFSQQSGMYRAMASLIAKAITPKRMKAARGARSIAHERLSTARTITP